MRLLPLLFALFALSDAQAQPRVPTPTPAPPPPPSPGVARTQSIKQTLASIDDRVHEIQTLKAQVERDGQAVRLTCIDDKLKKATRNRETAIKLAEDAFSVPTAWDALLLRQVYAVIYVEEARACTDVKVGADGKPPTVVEKGGPEAPPGGSSPFAPTRPPTLDRPPLASTY